MKTETQLKLINTISTLLYLILSVVLIWEAVISENVIWMHYAIATSYIIIGAALEIDSWLPDNKKFLTRTKRIILITLLAGLVITSIII